MNGWLEDRMKLLHISIPKNGGTYIANSLLGNYAEGECLFVDEETVTLGYFLENAEAITSDHKFIGGHIPFSLVQPYADKFDLIISSYREPWRRAWSAFRFITRRMPEWEYLKPKSNADAAEKFSAFMTDYFIANIATRNAQCGYLGDTNLPDAALENIQAHNIHMLSCSRLNTQLPALARQYGLRCDVAAIQNKMQDAEIWLRPGDHPALDEQILNWFDGDFALYQRLSAAGTG
jgi:hypothetical protein